MRAVVLSNQPNAHQKFYKALDQCGFFNQAQGIVHVHLRIEDVSAFEMNVGSRLADDRMHVSFIDLLKMYQADPQTEAILMMGEIGGTAEEEAAAYVKAHVTKPVAAFIAGRTAPKGKRMGHAGAIISGGKGTAEEKIAALEAANIEVAQSPADMGAALQRAIKRAK